MDSVATSEKNKLALVTFFNNYGRCCAKSTFKMYPPVICKDGAFMSVQAGEFYYSEPEEFLEDASMYESFEIRTELPDESIQPYRASNDFTDSDYYLYKRVGRDVIDSVIEKHGGIDTKAVDKYLSEKIDWR